MLLSVFLYAGSGLSLTRVVIDAGHGGHDPGAVSKDGRTYEKNLTLDISRKFAEKIRTAYPEIKVTLTRDGDTFVSLNDRAVRANKSDAQLFISIHINSTKSNSPSGYSLHVLGQSSVKDRDLFAYNMDVCRRENAVILLEDDYSTKYQGFDPEDPESFIFMQLMQNSHLEQSLLFAQLASDKLASGPLKANRGIWQNPFYVLWKTAMPAVLVELGFISNSSDLEILRRDAERDRIANKLLDAFREYKRIYEGDTASQDDAPAPSAAGSPKETGTAPLAPSAPVEPSVAPVRSYYGIQIFAGRNKLPANDRAFLGYKPLMVEAGGLVKYVIGVDESLDRVREKKKVVEKKYPSCFIVEISDAGTPSILRIVKGI